ncbi:MAG: hypothetical protein KTR29_13095 [Rhodothermaceae bacterium]|nr:hypothetical protein [Rhodothermaceae bacterium]
MLRLPSRPETAADHTWSLDEQDRWTRTAYIATDQTRIDRYKSAKVFISENMTLTQESKRSLSRFFSLIN